ncbi:MAG: hypothetical protein P4M14_00715 [Gammaproteobacteria bacterium]|nr:hypothetical protein [Gammaproteobacteria bacterium]
MSFSQSPLYSSEPSHDNLDAPPAYEAAEQKFDMPPAANPYITGVPELEANAPPLDENNRGLENLSYDQVVNWWNELSEAERNDMQNQARLLLTSKKSLKEMRKEYQRFYPKEYYPKQVYTSNELSASDYYLMYYFCDQLRAKYPEWFTAEVYQAFQAKPPAYDELPQPPSYEEATRWWNDLPAEQKQNFQQRAAVPPEQVIYIRREYAPYHRYYRPNYVILNDNLDFYDYYLMSRYSSRFYGNPFWMNDYLFYSNLRATVELTNFAVHGAINLVRYGVPLIGDGVVAIGRGIGSAVSATGDFFGAIGSRAVSGGDKDKGSAGAILLGIAIVLGAIAVACSAAIASVYAGIKTLTSLNNLVHAKKIGRSLWRLACAGSAGYLGAMQGMVLGATVGSMIPGLGTAAGAILGAIFGSTILAAVGAAFGKYSLQLASWYRHTDDPDLVSATNAAKWDVKGVQTVLHENRVEMDTREIVCMLQTLKTDKSAFQSIEGSVAGTEANTEKNRYNKFLEAIKSGKDPHRSVRVDSHTKFMWSKKDNQIVKENVHMPVPKKLKM